MLWHCLFLQIIHKAHHYLLDLLKKTISKVEKFLDASNIISKVQPLLFNLGLSFHYLALILVFVFLLLFFFLLLELFYFRYSCYRDWYCYWNYDYYCSDMNTSTISSTVTTASTATDSGSTSTNAVSTTIIVTSIEIISWLVENLSLIRQYCLSHSYAVHSLYNHYN